MESNESILNNDLQIDVTAQGHLSETAKWAKFISVAGFIFSSLLMIFALYYISTLSGIRSSFDRSGNARIGTIIVCVFYIVMAIVWFIVSILQFKFAGKLQLALTMSDQVELNNAFHNLRVYYRMSGIITIVSLIFTFLGLLGLFLSSPGTGF